MMINKKRIGALACVGLLVFALTGCDISVKLGDADNENVSTENGGNVSSETGNNGSNNSGNGTKVETVSVDITDLFTERDGNADYDEKDAVHVTLSDNGSSADDKSVTISGNTVTITKKGTYILSGSLSNGSVVVDADSAKVQFVLAGADITNSDGAAIYVKNADKVFVTLAEGSSNSLATKNTFAETEDNIDGVIFSEATLTVNGSGKLTVTSTRNGIVSKDNLKITGGNISITAENNGLEGKDSVRINGGNIDIVTGGGSEEAEMKSEFGGGFGGFGRGNTFDFDNSLSEDGDSAKGIKSKGAIFILGGNITVDAKDDAVHSDGTINVEGGSLTLNSGDDGIHADTSLTINGGEIDITYCYEGLESQAILINGGTMDIVSYDDALNASDGSSTGFGFFGGSSASSCYIEINGGYLHVNAAGDGIDSNGNLTVNGGEIYVDGPSDSANGAIDYGDGATATVTGGTVVAVGASGMAENFGSDSTQGCMLVVFDSNVNGGTVSLLDSDGKEILTYEASKSFNSVVISSPEIKQGETYTVKAGTQSVEVTMTSLVYANKNTGFGGGGFGGGGFDRGGNFGGGQKPDNGNFGGEMPSGELPDGIELPDGVEPPENGNFGGGKPGGFRQQ